MTGTSAKVLPALSAERFDSIEPSAEPYPASWDDLETSIVSAATAYAPKLTTQANAKNIFFMNYPLFDFIYFTFFAQRTHKPKDLCPFGLYAPISTDTISVITKD